MRKIPALIFLSLLFLLFVTANVRAEVTTATRSNLSQAKASAAATLKTQIQASRAEYKTKVEAIKDANKKQIAEKIDQNLVKINKNRTDHFNKVLTRLTTLLNKIQTRKDKAKALGQNVAQVETAIIGARAAITAAQTAVTTQVGKDYVLSFTDETGLKTAGLQVRTLVGTDLKNVFDKVNSARRGVVDALKALTAVKNVDLEATPSAKETP